MSVLVTPGSDGRFGEFGGRFVPETLVPACQELEAAFDEAWSDPVFRADLDHILREYAGRPSMLTECHNLGRQLGIKLILMREDLNHTGAHKINNTIGQALLARRMGKPRVIAETGAGQHGVALADRDPFHLIAHRLGGVAHFRNRNSRAGQCRDDLRFGPRASEVADDSIHLFDVANSVVACSESLV